MRNPARAAADGSSPTDRVHAPAAIPAVRAVLIKPQSTSVSLLGGLCRSGPVTSCGVYDWHWPYTCREGARNFPEASGGDASQRLRGKAWGVGLASCCSVQAAAYDNIAPKDRTNHHFIPPCAAATASRILISAEGCGVAGGRADSTRAALAVGDAKSGAEAFAAGRAQEEWKGHLEPAVRGSDERPSAISAVRLSPGRWWVAGVAGVARKRTKSHVRRRGRGERGRAS